tara:strand:+ start:633 stop:872 length:240 start_codon:yes stop_codon:yes gene_type:complete
MISLIARFLKWLKYPDMINDGEDVMLKVRKAFRAGRPSYLYLMVGADGARLSPGDLTVHDGMHFIVKEVYAKQWVKIDG